MQTVSARHLTVDIEAIQKKVPLVALLEEAERKTMIITSALGGVYNPSIIRWYEPEIAQEEEVKRKGEEFLAKFRELSVRSNVRQRIENINRTISDAQKAMWKSEEYIQILSRKILQVLSIMQTFKYKAKKRILEKAKEEVEKKGVGWSLYTLGILERRAELLKQGIPRPKGTVVLELTLPQIEARMKRIKERIINIPEVIGYERALKDLDKVCKANTEYAKLEEQEKVLWEKYKKQFDISSKIETLRKMLGEELQGLQRLQQEYDTVVEKTKRKIEEKKEKEAMEESEILSPEEMKEFKEFRETIDPGF